MDGALAGCFVALEWSGLRHRPHHAGAGPLQAVCRARTFGVGRGIAYGGAAYSADLFHLLERVSAAFAGAVSAADGGRGGVCFDLSLNFTRFVFGSDLRFYFYLVCFFLLFFSFFLFISFLLRSELDWMELLVLTPFPIYY